MIRKAVVRWASLSPYWRRAWRALGKRSLLVEEGVVYLDAFLLKRMPCKGVADPCVLFHPFKAEKVLSLWCLEGERLWGGDEWKSVARVLWAKPSIAGPVGSIVESFG